MLPNNELTLSEELATDVETSADRYLGAVFIIPFDAPVPNELRDAPIQSGSLLARLGVLDEQKVEPFVILPLRGEEMLELSRVWNLIAPKPPVYTLHSLPGARYDVLFDQGARALGLRSVDWPIMAAALARAVTERQRAHDADPWAGTDPSAGADPRVKRLEGKAKKTAGPIPEGRGPLADPAQIPPADDDAEIG